jgi:hypothetical protein
MKGLLWILLLGMAPVLGAQEHRIQDPRYHTFEEVEAELDSFARTYPELTLLDTLGFSHGYFTGDTSIGPDPILAIKISDNADVKEDEPSLMFNGIHHAEEVLGLEMIMDMIPDLLENYESDPEKRRLVDSLEIWFMPCMSPDGHHIVTTVQDTGWRKNARDNNENGVLDLDYDGVDPNRNYDFNWALGGESQPPDYFYKGPYPFSEPENRAMRDFCERERFTTLVNYHSPSYSFGEIVYFPWTWTSHNPSVPPDWYVLVDVAGGLAAQIVSDYDPQSTYSAVRGEAEVGNARNWQYGTLGIIALTVEICSRRCQVPPEEVDDIVGRNMVGAYWLCERSLKSILKVNVRDTSSGAPLEAMVRVIEIDTLDSIPPPRRTHPSTGSSYRLLLPGTYSVEVSISGYVARTVENVVVDSLGITEVNVLLPVPTEPAPVPFALDVQIPIFVLERTKRVKISVYDTAGRLVRELVNAEYAPGFYEFNWDGRNGRGLDAGSGVFFARVQVGLEYQKFKLVRFKGGTQ